MAAVLVRKWTSRSATDAFEQLQAIDTANSDAELTITSERNEAEWEDKLETAREKADITTSKGTLTTLYQH